MPRLIEERWSEIGFDVTTENLPTDTPNGPDLTPFTTLILLVPMLDGQRVIRIPFTDESRTELIRKLTGGIVIANGNQPIV